MTDYTLNYRFALPTYNIVGWGDQINGNFVQIDTLLSQFTTAVSLKGLWTNGTMYAAGVSVIDAITGHIWQTSTTHTSAAAPTTFAMDRAANPTYWADITNPAVPAAASATAASLSAAAALTSQQSAAASAAQAAGAVALTTFRNRVVNGSMEINQRGQSSYAIAANSSVYTLDRWLVSASGSPLTATPTVSASSFASRKNLRITGTVAAGNTAALSQRFEAATVFDLAGKQVTVQFNAATSVSAGTMTFQLVLSIPAAADNFNGTMNVFQSIPVNLTYNPSTVSATFNALPAQAANGIQIQLIGTQAGASGDLVLSVTNFSLESGIVVNSYERLPPSIDYLRCQRYYQSLPYNFLAYAAGGATFGYQMTYNTAMRITPTATAVNPTYSNAVGLAFTPYNVSVLILASASATGMAQFAGTVVLNAEL